MIVHDGTRIPTIPHPQDPDEVVRYKVVFRPDVWAADTVYYTGESFVLPPQFNGFYYQAKSGGTSGATVPDFPQKANETVIDGGVEWVAIPYNLRMGAGDRMLSAVWSSDRSEVVISSESIEDGTVSALVSNLPEDASEVTITVQAFIGEEKIERSFIIKVRPL